MFVEGKLVAGDEPSDMASGLGNQVLLLQAFYIPLVSKALFASGIVAFLVGACFGLYDIGGVFKDFAFFWGGFFCCGACGNALFLGFGIGLDIMLLMLNL